MIRAGRRDCRHAARHRHRAAAGHARDRQLPMGTADAPWLMAGNLYSTQEYRPLPGLEPALPPAAAARGLPWRMEATADIRNMLAQGYSSLGMAGGQRMLLVDTPRCFRGGLSFIF